MRLKDLAVALGPERVEKPFARVLAEDDERAARAAAWCLERSEAKGVEGELMRAVGHASWRVRLASITALARGGGERSRATLVAALADPEAPVRHAAAHALGERAVMAPLDQEALRALAGALADSDATVRFAAAHALGHAGTAAVPYVGDPAGPATRAGVAARVLALGETGDAGAAAGIRTLLDEARKAGDPLLEAWCLRALEDAGAMEAGADSAGADSVRATPHPRRARGAGSLRLEHPRLEVGGLGDAEEHRVVGRLSAPGEDPHVPLGVGGCGAEDGLEVFLREVVGAAGSDQQAARRQELHRPAS